MSKILIFPVNNVAGLTQVITSLGHTPVYKEINSFSVNSVISEGPPGDDGVLMVLFTVVDSTPDRIASLKALNDLGYVLSVGRTNGTASTSISCLYQLGFSNSSCSLTNGSAYIKDDTILSEELKNNVLIPFSHTISYNNGINLYNPNLLLQTSSNNNISFYFEEGTVSRTNFTLKVPLFYIGFLWDLSTTAAVQIITTLFFRDVFSYVSSLYKPKFKVEGTVKDLNNVGLQRELSVYSLSTKKLLGTTISDSTGYYVLTLKNQDSVYIVYNPNGTEKPDIHYNIIPKEIS